MSRFRDLRMNLQRFTRSAGQDRQGQISIGPRQIYILPTRFGSMYAVLVLALLIGSINYANNLGFLLTFFLTGIGIVTILHTWRNLLDLRISFETVKPVFAGQDVMINLLVENYHHRNRGAIIISRKNDSRYAVNEIDALSTARFSLPLPAGKRGIMHIDRLLVSTQYPLGLLTAWVYLDTSIEALIYPAPSPYWEIPPTTVYSLSAQGDRGLGADDFFAHRNYRVSDSPKHIDWKIFARERGLMTKQFGGDRSERLWLALDLLPDADLETAISKLTRALLDAEDNNIEYGLKLPGNTIAINHGSQHKADCLKALSLYGTNSDDQ